MDETFDSNVATMIEKMIIKHVTIDDVKAILVSHEIRMESRKSLNVSSLPLVTVSAKVQELVAHSSSNF